MHTQIISKISSSNNNKIKNNKKQNKTKTCEQQIPVKTDGEIDLHLKITMPHNFKMSSFQQKYKLETQRNRSVLFIDQ